MNDFGKSKLNERYQNDAMFRKLVHAMRAMIEQHGVTPSEMREALFLAHYEYEMSNPRESYLISEIRMREFLERSKP